MFTVNIAATDSQASVNEDVVGHSGNAAWIIDGATGLGAALLEAPSDAAWLAQTIDAALRKLLAIDPMMATPTLVRRVILTCRDALEAGAIQTADGPHEHPSAAFVMLRNFGDHLELAGLADCAIAYVDDAGEARVFGDTSLENVEKRTLDLAHAILTAEPDISSAALFQRLLPQL
ncbi:MAG: hypothetical protein ACRYG4_21455, partial [Janthinobacterium lividum]